jgi:hypothetical protein
MRKFCGCKKESNYDKVRRFILRNLLTFFGRMENKLWRELYVFKPTKPCTCKNKNMENLKEEYHPNLLTQICLITVL